MPKNIANYSYPSSNLNEYNLDWVIKKLAELEASNTWILKDAYDPVTRTLNLSVVSLGSLKGV